MKSLDSLFAERKKLMDEHNRTKSQAKPAKKKIRENRRRILAHPDWPAYCEERRARLEGRIERDWGVA